MNARKVYFFQEGRMEMKPLLGGKGANLAEMTAAGVPVPPGFTITTEACRDFFQDGGALSEPIWAEIGEALNGLEAQTGQRFGDVQSPLIVSVRSGAVSSMPGMMDTILNLGLNDETVEALSRLTADRRFAYDCYRRLIQMFGEVVMGVEADRFERLLERLKQRHGCAQDQQLSGDAWQELTRQYQDAIASAAGQPFPQDVRGQLRMAVEAVFRSWHNPRARVYRHIHRIPDEQGTAVTVQLMVFGNKGEQCGTGVVFTRDPSTGEPGLYGEFLVNAQGEDVVAGTRTPQPIADLKRVMPQVYDELERWGNALEQRYGDMQDIEFTVERGKLYLLQTRTGKRGAQAALRIAVSLVREGLIGREEAVRRLELSHLERLLHRGIDDSAGYALLASGLPASPGAAIGMAVFDADTAESWSREGKPVILVRPETAPNDIHGVLAANGILTSHGGMTSHAAVVARGMGKPAVCGCESAEIDCEARELSAGGATIKEGDWLTLDGGRGLVIAGRMPLREPAVTDELTQVLDWADDIRRLAVYANADTPEDARTARRLGAQGIGLCRTEHMFFAPERLAVMQLMIAAESEAERGLALRELLPMQQHDFEGMFEAMDGLPVTIRLLDPPLHEFLPGREELERRLEAAASEEERGLALLLLRRSDALREANPMLGQRGCRLGIMHPEIYRMQADALCLAALACIERGIRVRAEIMIPLVGAAAELGVVRAEVEDVLRERMPAELLAASPIRIGTMIEVPRAALTAQAIAAHADFFSFGTNDLTQMTYGYSRDDAEGKFLSRYVERKLLPHNPFQVLDVEGVGQLIRMAAENGRAVKPDLKTGICGEHGGDRDSILFCHAIGLDYVSCSPHRIPMARIAAAQAALEEAPPQPRKEVVQI
ncbi:pyruvate, phosphate dikinase [Paenibacillus methanolicus]|uniref:Pyruvate, phosphate dikinase n=1 Tax=Paenibacillus methanolicus TaxID=582686 RepID=A0A5S5BYR9_9BACL|nr:pyruvate, phosphate dikinase [Paenibacillus methanolicus]TYP71220.1 pyruvate,orthophosphate dikinase [Paenibacillus methanolicus]